MKSMLKFEKPDDIVELVRDIMEGNADEALEALVIIFTEELEENESEVVNFVFLVDLPCVALYATSFSSSSAHFP